MTNELKRLEEALGGSLERRDAREIPGVNPPAGTEIVYFSGDGKTDIRKQFWRLTGYTNPPNATSGGVNDRGCKIVTPSGETFYAIGFHGDLEGWRMDIGIGAEALNLFVGRIEKSSFVISDGRIFALSDCNAEFY